jgi:hypothetical protein
VLGHVSGEQLAAQVAGQRERGDDDRQAGVERGLAHGGNSPRGAAQRVRAQGVEHPGDRRGKELQRREHDVHRRRG